MWKGFEVLGTSPCAIWREDEGQDLIEYSLLLAFVAMASASLFIGAGHNVKGIWSTTNSQLSAAASYATS
jgi:Flp pilus assembly pilin Flp